MTIPQVKIECEFTPSTWTDVTAFWRRVDGLSITRGRPGLNQPCPPGQCSFTLRNDAGTFTPGISAYALARWVPVRVSASVDGVAWYRRFTGFVESGWPVAGSRRGVQSTVTLTCVDRSSLDGMRTLGIRAHEILTAAGATAHWPLTMDSAEASGRSTLAGVPVGDGGALEWGAALGLDSSESGLLQIANPSTSVGTYLSGSITLPDRGFTLVCVVASPASGPVLTIGAGVNPLKLSYTGTAMRLVTGSTVSATTTGSAASGVIVEMVSVVEVAGVVKARLRTDGTETEALYYGPPGTSMMSIGRDGSTLATSLGVGHVAYIPAAMTYAEMDTLAASLEASSGLLAATLALSGVGAVAVTGEPSGLRALPTLGRAAQLALDDYAISAPARYFVARDGTPTWRPLSEQPAEVTLTAPASGEVAYTLDLDGYVTDATVAMADGTEWAYVMPSAPLARNQIALAQAWADPNRAKSVARWLASGVENYRLDGLMFDLGPLADAATLAVAGLEVGDRFDEPTLPGQIPSGAVLIVEGYAEQIDQTGWRLTFNTTNSPGYFVIGVDEIGGDKLLAP